MIYDYATLHMVVRIFSYMGDLQLHTFTYFMRNQVEWHMAMKSSKTNEETVALWIREELGMATNFLFSSNEITPFCKESANCFQFCNSNINKIFPEHHPAS